MYYEKPQGVSVHGGFPNPAADASLQTIDITKLLVRNPVSTYLMRIEGNEWRSLGIFDGDIVLVDRALGPRQNDLVVWWEGGIFAISPKHAVPLDSEVWGVATAVIHQYRSKP